VSSVLRQNSSDVIGKTLAPGWEPVSLKYSPGKRTVVHFSNGKSTYASCLRCPNTPCSKLAPGETIPSNFDRFPADRNSHTCAALAITGNVNGAPIIDPDRCIMCGVCASRCPVGAIRLEPGRGAFVEDELNAAFMETKNETVETNEILLRRFAKLDSEGTILGERDDIVDDIFSRSNRVWTLVGDRYPNMLARNLLIGAGLGASVGRKGNNHMRMDIILSPPGIIHGVSEVEFGQEAVLNAPRDTLDSLAVLVSRYDWTLETTTALIVTDILPNRRSEYWHIIKDISNVLQVRIGTVTVLSLMLIIWNRLRLDLRKEHPFYVDRDTDSYRATVLNKLINRSLNLGTDPRPQVDIAK